MGRLGASPPPTPKSIECPTGLCCIPGIERPLSGRLGRESPERSIYLEALYAEGALFKFRKAASLPHLASAHLGIVCFPGF